MPHPKTAWLRRAVPLLRRELALPGKPRIRLLAADGLAELGNIAECTRLNASTALIVFDPCHPPMELLLALAHELLHAEHGYGHGGKWARAARRMGFAVPLTHIVPTPRLRRRVSRVRKLLGNP